MVTKGETMARGINWEDGINTYTLLYLSGVSEAEYIKKENGQLC